MDNGQPKTVCCLTSHPARIKNCYRVVKSLLGNTVVPDRVYLTLARSQFPRDIDGLPPLIRRLVVENPRVFINWVDVDTKIMKKVVPVLKYLDSSDNILCCDDDILYPVDYIGSRLGDMSEFGDVPLTGCTTQTGRTLYERWGIPSSIGYACAFKKRHVDNIGLFMNQDIVGANNEDGMYSMVEWLNGIPAHDVTKYGMDWLRENCTFNETDPSRLNGSYLSGDRLLDVFRKRVCEITGYDIFDPTSALFSRGFFREEQQRRDIGG